MSISDKYFKLKQENDKLKRLLAFVCNSIDTGGKDVSTRDANELKEWWDEHKPKEDKQ